jgi:hypothetical protein
MSMPNWKNPDHHEIQLAFNRSPKGEENISQTGTNTNVLMQTVGAKKISRIVTRHGVPTKLLCTQQ